MSRWIALYATSPSGKTLFVCRVCGRKTPAPTATCPEPPEVYQRAALECSLIEELEEALAEGKGHPDRWERDELGDDVRVLLVGHPFSKTPNGKRSHVQWSTRKERWNSTEVYFEREEDKNK